MRGDPSGFVACVNASGPSKEMINPEPWTMRAHRDARQVHCLTPEHWATAFGQPPRGVAALAAGLWIRPMPGQNRRIGL